MIHETEILIKNMALETKGNLTCNQKQVSHPHIATGPSDKAYHAISSVNEYEENTVIYVLFRGTL